MSFAFAAAAARRCSTLVPHLVQDFRRGCPTGGAPDHPRFRARTRRLSARPLRGPGRRAGVRGRARAGRAPCLTASSICSGEMGSPYSLMPSSPADRNRGSERPIGPPAARMKPGRKETGPTKSGAEAWAQQALEPTASAQMPRLDGRRGNAERFGDLGNVELLDLAQDEDRTKRRRELVDRLVDHSPHLPAGNHPFRRRGHRAAHQHFAIIVDDRNFALIEQRSPPLRGAGMHKRIVDDDAGEPGGQRGSAREALDRRERLQISALHRILGIFAIAQYLPCSAKQPLVVALHDEADGPGIAARDTGRELEIGAALIARGSLSAHARAPSRGKRADDCSGVRDGPVFHLRRPDRKERCRNRRGSAPQLH